MPWDIRRSGSWYQVVQRDNGRVVGRHSSREAAERQQSALYASEEDKEKSAQPTRDMWHGQFFPRRK